MQSPGNLAEPLLDEVVATSSTDSHADRIAAAGSSRKSLGHRLWCAGVWIRLLTVVNGRALVGAVGYSMWLNHAVSWLQDDTVDLAVRFRAGLTFSLPLGCGLGLLALEWQSTCDEKATRRSIGCAFGGAGRCLLLLLAALVMAPLIHPEGLLAEPTRIELYATAGATAFTVLDALLQAWILSCVPAYRNECVSDFQQGANLHVDQAAYPPVYQRDEGSHLHLGVLLPGHSSRESCSMTVNVESVQLVGEVLQARSAHPPSLSRPWPSTLRKPHTREHFPPPPAARRAVQDGR